MHLPDGYLSTPVSVALAAASAGGVAIAVRRSGADEAAAPASDNGRAMVLMGVVAAFVFVAQMINFPIAVGTSGHVLGAALVTALLGPWRAVLVLTVVVGLQALLFADGGLMALGANVFNMAIAASLVSGVVLGQAVRRTWTLALAAWLSVIAAAALTAGELVLSGKLNLSLAGSMVAIHGLIGLGEAVITVAAYQLLVGARPDLEAAGRRVAGAERWRLVAVLAVGLLLLPLASGLPDGLEAVAERAGISGQAAPERAAPLPDYGLPGRNVAGFDSVGTYVSAAVGMVACALVMVGIGVGIGRRRPRAERAV